MKSCIKEGQGMPNSTTCGEKNTLSKLVGHPHFNFVYVYDLKGDLLFISDGAFSFHINHAMVPSTNSFIQEHKKYHDLFEMMQKQLKKIHKVCNKTLKNPQKMNVLEVVLDFPHFDDKSVHYFRAYEKVMYHPKDVNQSIPIGVQGICVRLEYLEDLEHDFCSLVNTKSDLYYALVPSNIMIHHDSINKDVNHDSIDNLKQNQCKLEKNVDQASNIPHSQELLIDQNNINKIVCKIIDIFEKNLQYKGPETYDQWERIGKSYFEQKIEFFVFRNIPIQCILPAFPFKSRNTEKKVLGHLPDMGEKLAIQNLNRFCELVSSVYAPGCYITIVSDGRVFSDLLSVEEKHVSQYNKALRSLIDVSHTKWLDLDYFFATSKEEYKSARVKLLQFFGKNKLDIEQMIEEDSIMNKMYCGFTRFVMEDLFSIMDNDKSTAKTRDGKWIDGMSYTRKKKKCKEIAKQMMIRNDAYSSMISLLFPLHVRLSIHAHNNTGPKFAIKLLESSLISHSIHHDAHIPTPWHNVVVQGLDGKFSLMKRFKVEQNSDQYDLIYDKDGIPTHYRKKSNFPQEK